MFFAGTWVNEAVRRRVVINANANANTPGRAYALVSYALYLQLLVLLVLPALGPERGVRQAFAKTVAMLRLSSTDSWPYFSLSAGSTPSSEAGEARKERRFR